MTAEELSEVLTEQLTPVIAHLDGIVKVLTSFVALLGVIVGVCLAMIIWGRFNGV